MENRAARRRIIQQVWTTEILLALEGESKRFNVLLTGITGISDRILTERLRALEALGLVQRDVEAGPPVRVFYGLTRDAAPYLEPLRALESLA